jgi:Transposase IS116/IS110/IS902 family
VRRQTTTFLGWQGADLTTAEPVVVRPIAEASGHESLACKACPDYRAPSLGAYAGLAPVRRQSGTSLAAESRSRRGNHRLKNAMFPAAFASLRDPASKAFYDRKRAEGKRHNAALICLARRRCDVILAMLRTGQPYQPGRPAPGLPRAA